MSYLGGFILLISLAYSSSMLLCGVNRKNKQRERKRKKRLWLEEEEERVSDNKWV